LVFYIKHNKEWLYFGFPYRHGGSMSDQFVDVIANDLKQKIDGFQHKVSATEIGVVLEAGDGIAQVSGLPNVRSQELVEFENGTKGIAFNLEHDRVGVTILGEYSEITEGVTVRGLGSVISTPVGPELIGRVVNALGEPIDGKGPLDAKKFRPIERIAPGVIDRQDVDTPVQTGIKAIDGMVPIGRGQRELIIGDRQTGKTAIALDTIINQKGKDLICIYVAIGQKKAAVAKLVGQLEEFGAMEHTIIVMASADDPAGLQYIAPYVGCTIGEEFMEEGQDALIVYDDLSKHAWAYRQVSLLMRRPPGREAYPGDVFYLHSRLLERASRMATHYVIVPKSFEQAEAEESDAFDGAVYRGTLAQSLAEAALEKMADKDKYKIVKTRNSGGSLTALPIIETLLGDVSAYIPTNVISITDGQIYLESNLFNAGIRPAINVGISVSRVGGSAQTKAIKQVAASLRLDMAAYRNLAAFAQFGSDLDKATQAQLKKGQTLQELLKQPQYQPVALENQVMALYGGTRGYADTVPVSKVSEWEVELSKFMATNYPEIGESIAKEMRITEETEEKLKKALVIFQKTWKPS
jgi:F-type H+/Na+-transporting ATPase subunit alpha